jgi:RNA polymerase sigma-70 factor (ECF subfamily)
MDEQKLAEALRNQKPEAVQELVRAYGDRLLRSAFLLCGSETDAEDLVQETFLQAIRGVHRFGGRSTFYTWLHAILLNLSRHYHRERKRLVYDDGVAEGAVVDLGESPLSSDLEVSKGSLDEALGRLSGPHREVLELRYYEELKISDIAERLGVSKGTVKSRLHYALAEMQKLLPKEMNLFGASGTNEIETQ